ncbi:MAG: hypothetical protein LBU32_15250 [Clostridiales bacterium]|nr:hypothetical protein [Clostridiales bacterium]
MKDRKGIERHDVKDPVHGTALWQITDYPAHNIQPYYDIDSWSPDGRKIVFGAAYEKDVALHEPYMYTNDKGNLLTYDTETGEIEWIAGGLGFNSHTGVFPIWTPDGKHIVCGDTVRSEASNRRLNIFDAASHKLIRREEGLHPRQVSPDGKHILCLGDEGISLYDFASGEHRILYSFPQIIAHLPVYNAARAQLAEVAHTKWNYDGTRFLFRFSFSPGEYIKSLFVADIDGGRLIRINSATPRFHHPSWVPGENRLLLGDWDANGDPHHYLVDYDGRNYQQISKHKLAGHPNFNRARTQIVTDNYKGELGQNILLYDLDKDVVEPLASFTVNFVRSNAHPSWNHDGTQILYHSDHTGYSQLYVIPLGK